MTIAYLKEDNIPWQRALRLPHSKPLPKPPFATIQISGSNVVLLRLSSSISVRLMVPNGFHSVENGVKDPSGL